jgi:hypothetical protein
MLAAASAGASAQAADARVTAPAPPTQTDGTTADEEFDLNIERRHISEREFHAGTAVEAEGARGLRLGVGVALRTSDIEVLLLGVRGHVRFRGSLAPVLSLLDARRATTATPPLPTPP